MYPLSMQFIVRTLIRSNLITKDDGRSVGYIADRLGYRHSTVFDANEDLLEQEHSWKIDFFDFGFFESELLMSPIRLGRFVDIHGNFILSET
ncbi:hypothetical protein HHI36_016821 [Cryptolaemus montrouzieri]|uniref:Uncharacterized protein n=1 Tax=Cryptolaemus montrouzieri TaxID=559131 RepID=A0ABD2NKW7_9CUCU